jgi:hypothetical protein
MKELVIMTKRGEILSRETFYDMVKFETAKKCAMINGYCVKVWNV